MEIPANGVVLVDFYTTFCGPCRSMEPILNGIKTQFGDLVKVLKVDCEKEPELTDKFSVCSVPTLIIMKDGEVCMRKVGTMQQAELNAAITSAL